MADKSSEDFADTVGPEYIDCDSDANSDEFEDASEEHDLTRPSDWKPRSAVPEKDNGAPGESELNFTEHEEPDSTGHLPGSRDFVDEAVLQSWETGDTALSEAELEQKRLEAAQYKLEGNALYTDSRTTEACDKYTAGLRVCPLRFTADRAVLYANRAQMKKVMSLNDHAVKNCSKAIELNPNYLKALLRRAEIYEETDKLDEALLDYQAVLKIDPRHVSANRAVRSLPARIEDRNEKLKAEMMDNLKKLGNMVLNPFGLSTDNFKMEQNEQGSYNIKFEQNK